MPLRGKTILITRSLEQSEEFIRAVEAKGGKTVLFPTIQIHDPDSWVEVDEAIKHIKTFDGVIFTSRNAVEKFFERMKFHKIPPDVLITFFIFAVGEKTKSLIEKYNLLVTAIPENYTAESLGETIQAICVKEKRFLFPRGNLGKDIITEKLSTLKATVIPVTVYKTVQLVPYNTDEIKQKLLNGNIDVVTFTSPSTVKNFFSLFTEEAKVEFVHKIVFAVIGEVTAETLRQLGYNPKIIAEPSTVEGMIQAIENYYKNKKV
jgi:uroporphyrinogen-III synthase